VMLAAGVGDVDSLPPPYQPFWQIAQIR